MTEVAVVFCSRGADACDVRVAPGVVGQLSALLVAEGAVGVGSTADVDRPGPVGEGDGDERRVSSGDSLL